MYMFWVNCNGYFTITPRGFLRGRVTCIFRKKGRIQIVNDIQGGIVTLHNQG